MNYSGFVGCGERACDLTTYVQRGCEFEPAFLHALPKDFSLDILRRYVMDFVRAANLEYRQDIRMIKRGCGPGFEFKSSKAIRFSSEPVWKQLERDPAAEPRVFSKVHIAHTSRANQRKHLIRTDGCSNKSVRLIRCQHRCGEFECG